MEHSIFPPSGSERGIICPASVNLQGKTKPNIHMATGTVLHKIAEQAIEYGTSLEIHLDTVLESDGFKVKLTKDLIEVASYYVSVVTQFMHENKDAEMHVERRVDLGAYGDKYKKIFGHADVILDSVFDKLVVIDLKTGKGKSVAADSPQLKMYAAMAAGDAIESYNEIVTVIVQPRDVHGEALKIESFKPEDLKHWIEDTVLPAIDDSQSDDPTFRASEEGCRWCNYSGQCKAQAEFVLSTMSEDYADCDDFEVDDMVDPTLVSDEFLAKIYENTDMIKNWLESVKTVAIERMMIGCKIPGYKLVQSRTHRKWNNDLDLYHILRKELKIRKMDLYYEKMHTPTHMLEMFSDKENIVKRLNELIIKPEGQPTIAKESDKRQPLEISNLAEDYADV